MNKNIKTICIFASSSNELDVKFHAEAVILGELIAKNGYNIVYGASNRGLMGTTTKNAIKFGSHVTGVMPEKLHNFGIEEGECCEFILTKGMRERKAKMDEISQAIIALPGGFGTLEEVSEMIVQKQLGYCNKPIVILNTKEYYDNLINFFEDMIKNKFTDDKSRKIYFIAKNPYEAIEYINNYQFEKIDYISDKLKVKN